MQRLLITGGTGYLGGELVRQAQAEGWHVTATYFRHAVPADPATTWIALDVRDDRAVAAACDAAQPDVVIHTAFRQYDPDLWPVTAGGTRNIAIAARVCGARLIHLSSDVIFDGEHTAAYTERDPPNPITGYGAAKADAERFVTEHHPNAAIVRTSLIYGFEPIDRHTQFILDIADGRQTAQLFTDEYRCPIFVGDLATALLELARHEFRGVMNVAGSERMSRYAFGVALAQFYGRDPARLPAGVSSASPVRRPRNCTLDISLAQHTLQTPLRGIREVLAARKTSSE